MLSCPVIIRSWMVAYWRDPQWAERVPVLVLGFRNPVIEAVKIKNELGAKMIVEILCPNGNQFFVRIEELRPYGN